jgi:anti-sigma regulatory factor (Ser/Thr protein kinase)
VSAVDLELPAEASSAAAARAAVRALLVPSRRNVGRGADQQAVDRILLLTSEVVTNAILHARTPLRLTAVVDTGQVVVRVYDTLRTPPRRRSYRADAGTGRGMHLIEALADRWGVDETSSGKCVWFAIALAAGQRAASLG